METVGARSDLRPSAMRKEGSKQALMASDYTGTENRIDNAQRTKNPIYAKPEPIDFGSVVRYEIRIECISVHQCGTEKQHRTRHYRLLVIATQMMSV